jgi:Right handed beta helix region
MKKLKSFSAAIAVASALFALSAPAHAQATRTWVSGVGNDADPCSRTAPCKTFAGAISKTSINGIINCIDSGAYGTVTITKSITIDCHDVFASILNASPPDQPGITTGVIINVGVDAKDPWRTVRLRNIDISGSGSGNIGISILAATAVILEELEVSGNVKQGISDARAEASSMLNIKNTVIANNGGIGLNMGAQNNNVVLDNVQSIKNDYGMALGKTNTATANRSVFSNNKSAGIETDPGAQLMLDNSVVSYNSIGISSNGGPIALANSDVAFNGTGVNGATTSFGNNRIFGNTAAGMAPSPAGASSPALGQQ